MGEIRMMPRIGLNTNTPALLRHTENERPSILWIQICISQHQQTLVRGQFDVFLQVIEDLPGMELFDASVRSHSSLHNFLLLKNRQTLLNVAHLSECFFVCFVSPQFHCVHASEEDLEDGLHVVDEHPLEILLLFSQFWV